MILYYSIQLYYQYKVVKYLLYLFLISFDYSESFKLTSEKKESYTSNTTDNNKNFKQAKNKNLYQGCNDY